jgi:phage/plasmid-associated DNA primase
VRGCLEWQRIGLSPPEKVREAIQRYRQEEDILQDWIDDRCQLDKYAETPATKLYFNFADWWVRNVTPNRKKVPSQHVFGRWLTKKFKREKKGTYVYFGIDCEIIDVQSLLPFDVSHDIIKSIKKTNRLLVIDEDVPGGASAFIMQKILEEQNAYDYLDSKPQTLTSKEHRPAYGTDGDYFSKPSVEDIYEKVYGMMSEVNPKQFPALYS